MIRENTLFQDPETRSSLSGTYTENRKKMKKDSSVNLTFLWLDTITLFPTFLWLRTATMSFHLLGINQWDFGLWRLENALKNSLDLNNQSPLAPFLMTLDKSSQLDLIINWLFGTQKENKKPFQRKEIIKIAWIKLDSHLPLRTSTMPQLDGMEDLKFGPNSSSATPVSKLVKILFMHFLFPLTEFTLPLEERTAKSKSGNYKLSINHKLFMTLIPLLTIVLSILNINGLLLLVIMVWEHGTSPTNPQKLWSV